MGTLDDAIREHLELKRSKGASDQEIEQQEAEALGRGSAPAAPAPPAEPSPALAPDSQEIVDQPEVAAVDPHTGRNGFSEPEVEPAPESASADAVDIFDEDFTEHGATPSEEPTVRRATRPEPDPGPEPAEPPEDFLEETPDFLEETPEHDRLWFEQKPPKDFDFD